MMAYVCRPLFNNMLKFVLTKFNVVSEAVRVLSFAGPTECSMFAGLIIRTKRLKVFGRGGLVMTCFDTV